MYIPVVIALAVILPFGSALAEALIWHSQWSFLALCGKWFAFWGGGVRLLIAGLRQKLRPQFTARDIFGIQSADALPVVRELGAANLAMGLVGTLSLPLPVYAGMALAAGIFYACAGVQHAFARERNTKRTVAMLTDILIAIVLLLYSVSSRS